MPLITFILPDGAEVEVDVQPETSVMKAAIANNVPGIVGECGGSCACATCHVYVEGVAPKSLPEPSETESDMLDFTASPRRPGSRLSCQIQLTEEMTGLVLRVPETQV